MTAAPDAQALRPYADHAALYLDAGWDSPIPLGAAGQRAVKKPPPSAYTGREGKIPDAAQIETWCRTHAVNNIGVHLPDGVIGLDVDHYGDKHGADALAALETQLGALPTTYRSTSRGAANPSGIRLYRVPSGVEFPGQAAPGIEVIQRAHRYVAAWPSDHPELDDDGARRRYYWINDATGKRLRGVPLIDSLPELPERWLAHFTSVGGGTGISTRAVTSLETEAARMWLRAHGGGEACRATRGVLRKALAALEEAGQSGASRYDVAVRESFALVALAAEGHHGVRAAVTALKEGYLAAIEGETGRDPTEWTRMVREAVSKAAAVTDDDFWTQHDPSVCPGPPGSAPRSLWPAPDAPLEVAERYVALHRTDAATGLPTLRRWRGDFYEFAGTHWRTVSEETLHAELLTVLRDATYMGGGAQPMELRWKPEAKGKLGKVLAALVGVPGVFVGDRLEPDRDGLVSVANGALDLATRELSPHTPARFNLTALPFAYEPGAACPEWLTFLASLWGTDSGEASLLAEWFGYVLSGATNQQKILLLIGPPRSGKGTVARVLSGLLGAENVCAPTLARMGGTFGLQQFLGKSLAIVGDAESGARAASAAVDELKTISGEDVVTVHRKNRDDWSGRLPVRFVLAANNVPAFLDPSGALAERLLPLQFLRSFSGREDIELESRLAGELAGVLLWALDGMARLSARGRFALPESSTELKQALYEDFSPVREYLNQRCRKVDRSHWIERNELYQDYHEWCAETGRTAVTASAFGRDLRSVVPTVMGDGRQRRIGDKVVRVYYGVATREVSHDVTPG